MKADRPLDVVFFKTAVGREPVRLWLKALPDEECKTYEKEHPSGQ